MHSLGRTRNNQECYNRIKEYVSYNSTENPLESHVAGPKFECSVNERHERRVLNHGQDRVREQAYCVAEFGVNLCENDESGIES